MSESNRILALFERPKQPHSCSVPGDPKCLGCITEAYMQPGGCAATNNARKARKTRPQG